MKIKHLIKALKFIGIDSVVFDFLRHWTECSMWRKTAAHSHATRTNGLCVAVDMHAFSSETIIGHDFIRKLRQTTIPFHAFDMSTRFSDRSLCEKDDVSDVDALCEPVIRFRTVLAFANRYFGFSGPFTFASQPAWEFNAGLLECHPKIFKGVRHVVVNSDFCYDYFRTIAPTSIAVHKIRYPYIPPAPPCRSRFEIRKSNGIPIDAFVVLFHFNMGSSVARKNPEGALQACIKAFSNDKDAHLVIKIAGSSENSPDLIALQKRITESGISATLINLKMTRPQVFELMYAADVYISLHRGEGFGMGMLEAMSLGTPVICTNYGGNTEFCKPKTALLVNYKMVPNVSGDHFYVGVKNWPEPDIEQAAAHLRFLRNNPEAGKAIASRATAFINEHFSTSNFENDVRAFIDATRTQV